MQASSLVCRTFVWMVAISTGYCLRADEGKSSTEEPKTNELLVSSVRESLVTIRIRNRDGDELGLGTGFVISESGLIATNLHVVPEGRQIEVELWPSKMLEVVAIEATSRADDLAIVRVAVGKEKLKPLELADKEIVSQGAEVLAFGNPRGLRHSVVQGIVSAVREIQSHEMIQVAMPIEPGNSGGPLVDRTGKVRGIINMKSLEVDNVGFAVPVARLHELMSSRNPVTIERWVRLAGVDTARWSPLFGAHWRERAGVIDVQGTGIGFGGRALCLYQSATPDESYEVTVQVKLENESGAAGLVFHADGKDKHYGFYPTNGKLRLTCFQGPSVYSWEVIQEISSRHYAPGEWNLLKVAVSPALIRCFVNGELVIETRHDTLVSGKVGLAKFRDTRAQFRQFQVGKKLTSQELSESGRKWFEKLPQLSEVMASNDQESIQALAENSQVAAFQLQRLAQAFTRQAEHMRRLADDVRMAPVLKQLDALLETDEPEDLLSGALLIAALDHPDLDQAYYVNRVNSMANEIAQELPENASDQQKLKALDQYLFEENGFQGSQEEYSHEANNHIDRVIDDREGMPITLSLVYMELGRRLGLIIEGIGLPGRFVVRHRAADGQTQLIDVFEKARHMSSEEAARIITEELKRPPQDEDLRAQRTHEILIRILTNLQNSAELIQDYEDIRRYLEGLVTLDHENVEYRLRRGLIRYQTQRQFGAIEDFEWIINRQPVQINLQQVERLLEQIKREQGELN